MADSPDHAGVRFPPPLVFLGLLLLGFAAERLAGGLSFGLGRPTLAILGAMLVLAGLAPILAAIGGFRRAGTRPEPWEPSSAIVTGGVYRFTRNPMYLGMALIHAGLAVAFDGPLALATLPIAVAIIRTQVIAREERYLEDRFGDAYRAYKERVRRWL